MQVHFCAILFALVMTLFGFGITGALYLYTLIKSKDGRFGDDGELNRLIANFIILVSLLFYIWMCYKLVKAVKRKTVHLPEFDTTQGLYQFNRDAYDGVETVTLNYQ
uniref:Uncharacterized protein n=1 Tax=Caenorhabditis japonica TaxID=281687 RepID=A0A8R1HLZ7_CAEJA